jgi:hypothetical protein
MQFFFVLSSTLLQLIIKIYINCFVHYLLSTTKKEKKIFIFVPEL